MEPLQELIKEDVLHASYHRLCHVGIKLAAASAKPTNACVIVACTPGMQSHLCKCKVPREEHVNEFEPCYPHRKRVRRHRALAELLSHVLPEFLKSSKTSGTQDACVALPP